MTPIRTEIAAYIAIAYIFVILGGIFVHFLSTGESYTLKYSLMLPSTWLATVFSSVISWGLFHHFRWAWWLGFVCASLQLARMSSWLFRHFTVANLPGFGVFLIYGLLLTFLVALVFPGTRASCTR